MVGVKRGSNVEAGKLAQRTEGEKVVGKDRWNETKGEHGGADPVDR